MAAYRKAAAYRKHQLYRSTGVTTQTLVCTGFDANAFGFGTADVFYRFRLIDAPGFEPLAFGTHMAAGGIRLLFVNGIDAFAAGVADVSLGTREVFPHWWVDTFYGAVQVGYTRELDPSGFDAAVFGATTVRDNRQYAAPAGFDAQRLGTEALVAFARRPLGAFPVEPGDFDHWTPPRIHNVRQIAAPAGFDSAHYHDPLFASIHNVNRVLDLDRNGIAPWFRGVSMDATIANTARIVAPPGWGEDWGNALVAYSIRTLGAEGFDPSFFGPFMVVYNAAAQILPTGFRADTVSTGASVLNTRRYYDHVTLGDQSSFGTAYADFAIRNLSPALIQGIGGVIGIPFVSFAVRTLTPTAPAFGYGGWFGNIGFTQRLNTIAPLSVPSTPNMGTDYRIANVTPELRPYWDSSLFTQFGRAIVHHNPERLQPSGLASQAIGTAFVDFRTKHLFPAGVAGFRPNNLHSVRNTTPDAPGVQYIVTPLIGDTAIVPAPVVTANSLYPDGIGASAFGTAHLELRGLHPSGITPPYDITTGIQVGVPHLNGPLTITVPTIGVTETWAIPDFQPRTIWAPAGAPEQAVRNHPPGQQELIDTFLDPDNLVRPLFGTPAVDLKNRRVPVAPMLTQDSYGVPRVSTRPLYVLLDGIKATKLGIPVLNGGGLISAFWPDAEDEFGSASVVGQITNPWYFRPEGISPLAFGPTQVQNFNRTVAVLGIDAFVSDGTVVQRPPPPAEPDGLDATLFGPATFIDYRIRHVGAQGDDLERVGLRDRILRSAPARHRRVRRPHLHTGRPGAIWKRGTIQRHPRYHRARTARRGCFRHPARDLPQPRQRGRCRAGAIWRHVGAGAHAGRDPAARRRSGAIFRAAGQSAHLRPRLVRQRRACWSVVRAAGLRCDGPGARHHRRTDPNHGYCKCTLRRGL
jgi:hypothetical protein